MPIRLYGICVTCGKRFEFTPEQALAVDTVNERKYCGRRCRVNDPAKFKHVCVACGAGCSGNLAKGMLLCAACQTLAYMSCWRKIQCETEADARHCYPGQVREVDAYDCPLCDYWHATSNLYGTDLAYREAVSRLAVCFSRIGFKINEARGWDQIWIKKEEG